MTTTPERTLEGKFVLFSVSTGTRHEHWPVDAREMLESGAYTASQADGFTEAPSASVEHSVSFADAIPLLKEAWEHSPGVPLKIQKSTDPALAPAKPFKGPTRSKGRK